MIAFVARPPLRTYTTKDGDTVDVLVLNDRFALLVWTYAATGQRMAPTRWARSDFDTAVRGWRLA